MLTMHSNLLRENTAFIIIFILFLTVSLKCSSVKNSTCGRNKLWILYTVSMSLKWRLFLAQPVNNLIRLHCHILFCLPDIRHTICFSIYGKHILGHHIPRTQYTWVKRIYPSKCDNSNGRKTGINSNRAIYSMKKCTYRLRKKRPSWGKARELNKEP